MSGIRVELQLKDGSFATGMLRNGQSVASFRKELERVDPHFRKMSASGDGVARSIRKADIVNRDFLSTMRDITIVSAGVGMAFRALTGTTGGLIGGITQVNAHIERLKFQMLGMSNSAKPMEEAGASVDYLRKKALEVPFSLNEMANSFVKLKATGTDPMAGSLQSVADGIAAFGGTDEQLHRVTLGIVQMSGKGVIQMEEMRQQLGESMPNAMRLMARSMGVSVAELTKAISTGRVESGAALQAFYSELERTYGGEAQRMMETFSGQVSQLKANLQVLATSDGMTGFFEEQKAGLQEINDFLRSDEAKEWAKNIGEALTAMTRGIRIGVETFYDLRSEISMVAQVIAGGLGIRMFSRLMGSALTNVRLLGMGIGSLGSSMNMSARMMRVGSTALATYGMSARAAGLAVGGLRLSVMSLGAAVAASAPWLAALGAAIAIAGDKMGWFGSSTEDAYDSLVKFGAESKKQAKEVLASKETAMLANIDQKQSNYDMNFNAPRYKTAALAEINALKKEYQDWLVEKARILAEAEESETTEGIAAYKRTLTAKTREANEAYRQAQVETDKQRDLELSRMKETGKKAYQITEAFQDATLVNRKARSNAILETYDKELQTLKALQSSQNNDEALATTGRMIDFVNGLRLEAAEQARDLDKFGISLVEDIESDEAKVKRGTKALDGLKSSIKGIQAELAGAGNAFAKMQFQIERGDYGSVEQGGEAVAELHEKLKEATAQKEALDKLMAGDKKAKASLDKIHTDALEDQLELTRELANEEMNDAEKFQYRLNSGYYDGLGPVENIRKGIMAVVGAIDIQGSALDDVAVVLRENTFGPRTIDSINSTTEALGGVLDRILDINNGLNQTDFGMMSGSKFTSGIGGDYSRNGSMLDLIASVESGKGGYNSTLDNGRWTGGDKNLTSMTLKQILELQSKMLANPENRAMYGDGKNRGSSALGRYQIVSKTLKSLMKSMGLSGDELFDEGMQDKMAGKLLSGRGNSLVGLRQEWAGLKKVPDEAILAALKRGGVGPTRDRAAMGMSLSASAGAPPALPTYNIKDRVSERVQTTADLNARADETSAILERNRELKEQNERKKQLDKLTAEISGGDYQMDGMGKNYAGMVEAIKTGKLGKDRSPDAAIYKEILDAAQKLDEIDERVAERNKAQNQSKEQLKSLENERAEIATRIADEQARAADPNYVGQSNELRKLVEDLDKYVERVGLAYGQSSSEFAEAQNYRLSLLGQQRTLEATSRQTAIADEVRDINEGMMTKDQARKIGFERDLKRIDDWVAAARAAGLDEVEVARQAEEAKAAIRDKYQRETNPVVAQMEEWGDFSGQMMTKTTGWLDNMASGVSGLIMGTGDLQGAVNGILNDIITSQVKFLFSNMAGDKTANAAGKVGGQKGGAGGGKAKTFGQAHTGGIAGGRLRGVRANPMVFANAPKFHTGGIAGVPRLKKDEIPIIAKKKEGIFTQEQMAALAPVGSNSGGPITINAPVSVNGSAGSPSENSDLAKKMATEMESTMRGVVVDEIRKQQRPGNMMNNRR